MFECIITERKGCSYYSTINRGLADLSLLNEGFNFVKYMDSNILTANILGAVPIIEKAENDLKELCVSARSREVDCIGLQRFVRNEFLNAG